MAATPAIRFLERSGVEFRIHPYDVPEHEDLSYGEAVAAVLGVPVSRVFKTLVALVDGQPVVGIVPVGRSLGLKLLARARGGKRASMAEVADAERFTGYVVGGISPFGRRKSLPVVADRTIRDHDTVYVSGGRRGIQVEVAPADLLRLTRALIADIAEEHLRRS